MYILKNEIIYIYIYIYGTVKNKINKILTFLIIQMLSKQKVHIIL